MSNSEIYRKPGFSIVFDKDIIIDTNGVRTFISIRGRNKNMHSNQSTLEVVSKRENSIVEVDYPLPNPK